MYDYCAEVHLSFCNYTNDNLSILKVQVNGPLPKRPEGGEGGDEG